MQNPNKTKEQMAIDLMLEDLHTNHFEIRCTAKTMECEDELESLKYQLIDYLYRIRS